eukprot:CAMPEP_0117690880 /NCGR_PEP_ID=MMETSP0804-20121206/25388_1 /TAXON_ID=1074897 /ORGANISM="Tetraselmis astigmatica, Strain CCMP880" /LENGTH=172 /DNA_ID=CAMNT_0005504007 /DNA_START=636 /DNA_END=1153 /DNA_ORIENTATION=-
MSCHHGHLGRIDMFPPSAVSIPVQLHRDFLVAESTSSQEACDDQRIPAKQQHHKEEDEWPSRAAAKNKNDGGGGGGGGWFGPNTVRNVLINGAFLGLVFLLDNGGGGGGGGGGGFFGGDGEQLLPIPVPRFSACRSLSAQGARDRHLLGIRIHHTAPKSSTGYLWVRCAAGQ